MNKQEFEKIFKERVTKTESLLLEKADHYATNLDRMHNFKRAGAMNQEHPVKSLDGFLTKHLVSYKDMIDKINKGGRIDRKLIDEKIGDIITYFFLQEALMKDTDCIIEF